MQLLYVYMQVNNFEQLKKGIEFNLGGKIIAKYDEKQKQLSLINNDTYVENLYGNHIINISAVCGRNGSGKSNILSQLAQAQVNHNMGSYIYLYEDGKFYYLHTNIKYTVVEDGKLCCNKKELPEKKNTNNIFKLNITDYGCANISTNFDEWFERSSVGYETDNSKFVNNSFNHMFYKMQRSTVNDAVRNINDSIFQYITYLYKLTKKPVSRFIEINLIGNFVGNITTENLDNELRNWIFNDYSNVTKNIVISLLNDVGAIKILKNDYFDKGKNNMAILKFCKDKIDDTGKIKVIDILQKLNADSNIGLDSLKVEEYLKEDSLTKQLVDLLQNLKLPLVFNYKYWGVSTGFQKKDILFSLIIKSVYELCKYNKNIKTIQLLLDEPDTSFHPEWRQSLIFEIVEILEKINVFFAESKILDSANIKYEIVLATNDPILLSDIPKSNIVFLKSEEEEGNYVISAIENTAEKFNTFGATTYTLYKHAFFLDDNSKGKMFETIFSNAAMRLKEIENEIRGFKTIRNLNLKIDSNLYKELMRIERIFNLVGDDLYRVTAMNYLNSVKFYFEADNND